MGGNGKPAGTASNDDGYKGKPKGSSQVKIKYEQGVYEGELKNGNPHGNGTFTDVNGFMFLNGTVYKGDFRNGKPHGNGEMKHENGDVYEGKFKNGMLHGNGTYTGVSGAVYKGQYKDDKRHGNGTIKYRTGNEYKGDWVKGKKHGTGTFKEVNSDWPIQVIYNHGKQMSTKRVLPVNEGPPLKRPCTNEAHSSDKTKSNDTD
ncbi:hypothetical protein ACHAXR_007607, partial [Thalassiosira sp. AJA248-18]